MLRQAAQSGRQIGVILILAVIFLSQLALSSRAHAQWHQPGEFPLRNHPSAEELRKYEDVVEIEAVADLGLHGVVKIGEDFTVGVIFTIRRDWRIFWQAPSDRLPNDLPLEPTTLEVVVPEGFTVGEVQYPVPTPWGQADGSRQFIYQHETALLVEISADATANNNENDDGTPPAPTPSNELVIQLIASWSIQKEGQQRIYHYRRAVELVVPFCRTGAADADPIPKAELEKNLANRKRLAEYQARVPKPFAEAGDIEAYWERARLKDYFVLDFADADHVDFFPIPDQRSSVPYAGQEIGESSAGDGVLLHVYYGSRRGELIRGGAIARGVVVQQRGARAEYYFVVLPQHRGRSMPWPQER